MTFLNTLLIIFLLIMLMGYLSRLFLPFLVRYTAKRMMKRMGVPFEEPKEEKRKKGTTIIDNKQTDPKEKGNLDDLGDYTEFEEIKD
ncbi:MAG: hypothetical protein Q7J34_10445 [Bacteroidales bacterium]|jgi:hypothetical protein|nr:hypothetical protein [Bacteroidales bacterium]